MRSVRRSNAPQSNKRVFSADRMIEKGNRSILWIEGSGPKIHYNKKTPLRDVVHNLFKIHLGKESGLSGTGPVFTNEFKVKIGSGEAVIKRPALNQEGKGIFAVLEYDDKRIELKEEPHTWRSGIRGAFFSEQNKRVVFESPGRFFGTSSSRKTDYIGGKLPIEVEAECRKILDNRCVLEELSAKLKNYNNQGSAPRLALANCIKDLLSVENPDYKDLSTESDIHEGSFDAQFGVKFSHNGSEYLVGVKAAKSKRRDDDYFSISKKSNSGSWQPVEMNDIICGIAAEKLSIDLVKYRAQTAALSSLANEESGSESQEDEQSQEDEKSSSASDLNQESNGGSHTTTLNSKPLPKSSAKEEIISSLPEKRDEVVDKKLLVLARKKEGTQKERQAVTDSLSLGAVINALSSMSDSNKVTADQRKIRVRLDSESTKETVIEGANLQEMQEGYFAKMKYNGETYKLREEPYTFKSGPRGARSKQTHRVVFEREGSLFGKWESRPTDHVGFKEPFLGSLGTSLPSQVEKECRMLLDSRVRLREMANCLEGLDWNNVEVDGEIQSPKNLDPKKMALVDCIRVGAFDKAPHPGLSLEPSKGEEADRLGLKFSSTDGEVFSIRADKNSKSLVVCRLVSAATENEWKVMTPQEVREFKIYDKAIKAFGIDKDQYREFVNRYEQDLGIESEKNPHQSSFARGENFANTKSLSEHVKMERAFIVAADKCGLTKGQAAAIALFAVSERAADKEFRLRDIDNKTFYVDGAGVGVSEFLKKQHEVEVSPQKIKSFSRLFQSELKKVGVIEDGVGKHLWQIEESIVEDFLGEDKEFTVREVNESNKILEGIAARNNGR
jgi:hypothetical protein